MLGGSGEKHRERLLEHIQHTWGPMDPTLFITMIIIRVMFGFEVKL